MERLPLSGPASASRTTLARMSGSVRSFPTWNHNIHSSLTTAAISTRGENVARSQARPYSSLHRGLLHRELLVYGVTVCGQRNSQRIPQESSRRGSATPRECDPIQFRQPSHEVLSSMRRPKLWSTSIASASFMAISSRITSSYPTTCTLSSATSGSHAYQVTRHRHHSGVQVPPGGRVQNS